MLMVRLEKRKFKNSRWETAKKRPHPPEVQRMSSMPIFLLLLPQTVSLFQESQTEYKPPEIRLLYMEYKSHLSFTLERELLIRVRDRMGDA